MISDDKEPKRGAIARCSLGMLGLILSSELQEVAYPDGSRSLAWTGIQLLDDSEKGTRLGGLWSSRNPTVLCQMEDMDVFLDRVVAARRRELMMTADP